MNDVFVIPALHKDEALSALCPGLRWLCPVHVEETADLSVVWPLSPADVRACLRETAEWAESGLTGAEARSVSLLERSGRRARQENRVLREHLLADNDAATPRMPEKEVAREAQRLLLLAWAQEERVQEISRLAARYKDAAQRLHSTLHAEDEQAEAQHVVSLAVPFEQGACASGEQNISGDADDLLPAWKPVLERLALFLPESAAVCTTDARLIASLCDANLCRTKLEAAGLACPDALLPVRERLYGERLPMWRVLGYTQAQAERPWLDVERVCVVIMPQEPGIHA